MQHSENGWSSRDAASIGMSFGGAKATSWLRCIEKAERRRFLLEAPARILDPRVVRRVCEELGLDRSQLPGPKSRV